MANVATHLGQATEAHLQLLTLAAESAANLVILQDENGHISWVNQAFCDITGYSREEAIGQEPSFLLDGPDTDPSTLQRLVEKLESNQAFHGEIVNYRKDRTPYWCKITLTPLVIGGKRCGSITIQSDITENKRLERELAQSLQALKVQNELSEAILETAGCLIIVLDTEGRIVRFNRACEQTTGWTFDEVAGRRFYEFLVPPEEIQGVAATMAQLVAGNFPNDYENHWVARDGTRRLIRWRNTALNDESGRITYIIGNGLDVTEIRAAQQEVVQIRDRYAAALRGSRDGIYDWDIKDDRTYFSPRTLEMLGYSEETLDGGGDPFYGLIHPEEREAFIVAVDGFLASGEEYFSREVRVRHRNGSYRWFLVRGAAMRDENGVAYRMSGSHTDITASKQQLARLRESEARLEEAQSLARIGSWHIDARTGQVTWSAQIFRHFGMDPTAPQPTFEQILNLVHPDDAEGLAQRIQATGTTGEPFDYTCRALAADGRPLYVRTIGRVQRNERGRITHIVGSTQDVTDIKLAELAYKRSEDRLLETQRLAKLGSWELDIATGEAVWSEQAFVIYGRNPRMGPPTRDEFEAMLAPDDREKLRVATKAIREGVPQAQFEINFGGKRLLILGRPVFDRGQVVRVVGAVQDVTAQRRADENLANQHAFFRRVIDTDPNIIFVKDASGRYTLVNEAMAAAVGIPQDQLVGRHNHDVEPDAEMVSRYLDEDRQIIDGTLDQFVREQPQRCANGFRWLHTIKRPIISPETGERLVLGIGVDVTERIETQRALEAAREEALESSRMKSEFLANMSHEIRTPMNGVIGMADLLLDSSLDLEQLELARTIRDSAESLLSILNDILDFSKIEAGKMALESNPVDLADLLERVAATFSLRAEEKGLRLSVDIDWRRPWTCATDAVRVRQILTNIVGNAVKFTDAGEVRLRLLSGESGRPRFEVIDTGIGIDAERLDSIFDAFTQADGSTTRKYGGTGLGLAIVKQLARLLGGAVGVDSEMGRGSRFWIEIGAPALPASDEERRLLGRQIAIESADDDFVSFVRGALLSLGAAVVPTDALWDVVVVDSRTRCPKNLSGKVVAFLSRGQAMPPFAHEGAYEPATRRGIAEAILRALGAKEPGAERTTPPTIGARVLLAEDNTVNQRVAIRQLEKLGCGVDLARTGLEAVAMSESGAYDLILMDVQMPELDGLEATRRIRARDSERGIYVPIVAMTAHAMEGDRERCLDAGMDDYLSKPLRREDLRQMVTSWVKGEKVNVHRVIDDAYLADTFGDDHEFMISLLETYIASSSDLMERLRQSFAARDAEAVKRLAHTLKGSSRSIGANAMGDLFEAIENGGYDRVGAASTAFEELVQEIEIRIERLRSSGPA